MEWSQKWSSCTELEYVDSETTSRNISSNTFTRNFWFIVKTKTMNGSSHKKNSFKTSLPSSTSSLQETMDAMLHRTRIEEKQKEQIAIKNRLKTLPRVERDDKKKAERAWKIRLYPTKKKRNRLNQWMGIYAVCHPL
jgi:hypothetical protein